MRVLSQWLRQAEIQAGCQVRVAPKRTDAAIKPRLNITVQRTRNFLLSRRSVAGAVTQVPSLPIYSIFA